MNPYISECGKFSAAKTAITKKESKYPRATLCRIILPIIHHNPAFNNYYHLKRSQSKRHLSVWGTV